MRSDISNAKGKIMLEKTCGSSKKIYFISTVLSIYVILIGVGVPLIVRDKYFDILVTKYYYYCGFTILMMGIVALYTVVPTLKMSFLKRKVFSRTNFNKFTLADYAVMIYYLTAIISTVTSDYLYESFWGNEGRFTGLFLMTWYVASYFCVSRLWKYNKHYIDLILGAGMLVCLFGITDYFRMDIFHFKVDMLPNQWDIFTSTIGNINTYTAYVGMIVAISVVLFTMSDQKKSLILYYVSMVIGFFAIIMGVSDNAYLSLGALFGFLPLILFRSKRGIFRYFVVLVTFFSVIQCIDLINSHFGDKVLGIDGAFTAIKFDGLNYLLIALWAAILIWYFVRKNKTDEEDRCGNTFRNIWIFVIVIISLGLLYLLYDCNIAGNSDRYESLKNYLFLNDDWGTHRGYIWRNAIEHFEQFSLWKKVVGYGPETFGLVIMRATTNNPYNQIFDSAHNEYLHLLITVGIVGLGAYLVFIIANIKRGFTYKKRTPYIIAMNFAVICYSVQAFVNLNVPVVTPVFWLLLSMISARTMEE